MSLNFDPAMTASNDSHWRPTNQWRPRSLTPAARAQYLATKMEPDPQSYGTRRKVIVDASFVATQLAKHGGRGPDMAKIQNPQGLNTEKASQAQTPLGFPSGNQRENYDTGRNQTRCDKAGSQRRTEQDKTEPHKTHSKPESKTGSQKLGYAKIGFDERGFQNQKHQAGRKMSNDKIGYDDKNEFRTGHDKTGHDLKEPKTGPNKTGQDKTGHSKPEHKMEGSKATGGHHTRTARPVQKETLQPSVLMLGHSGGTSERLRVTPRCHSADPASPRPTPHPARSTGSPYLENQQITLSTHQPPHHPPHYHHHHHHHQPSRHHHQPSQRYQSHSHHHHHHHHLQQPGKERSKSQGGSSSAKVVSVPLRRHGSAEQRASSERVENGGGGGERIGRCPAGAPAAPFYKAALALMQAQRLRGSVVRIPASPSSSSSSSPATSPRNSVFYLPPPPPPPPPVYRLPPGQRVFLAQHNPHSEYPNHGTPKSILRPPPSPVQRSRVELNSGPSLSVTHSARPRSTQPPVSPRPSDSLRGTPRKKVTFGNDVIVHLRHHDVGATGRVLSSTV